MKKIGVISDTHVPRRGYILPDAVLKLFDGVDLILHAGDIEEESVLDELAAIAPVKAVCGNMDSFQKAGVLPDKLIVDVEDCRIGLIHGWGAPEGLEERVLESFGGKRLDAIVFGHSHFAKMELRNGILLFNPGSPADKRFAPWNSAGLLTVNSNTITGEIIKL